MNDPSNPRLSERQQDILRAIDAFQQSEEMSPTLREIMEVVGLASTSTVSMHLDNLERLGMITRHLARKSRYYSPRTIRLTIEAQRWLDEVAV